MMRSSVQALLVLVAVTVCSSSAWALPPDQIVTYSFRETPSDPQSDVLIRMELYFSAQSQSGDDITWRIISARFREPTSSGENVWTEDSPSPSSWIVTHADPDIPTAIDFTDPPAMTGTATAESLTNDDLDYDLTPGTCDATCQSMYGGQVIAAIYRFAAGTTVIAEEEEEEPAETEIEEDS